jgi:SAM-dependent methyltransferase
MTLADDSFTTVFSAALRGARCTVSGVDPVPTPLPVQSWTRDADPADGRLLALCVGATLDIGCGPGRLAAGLARDGRAVLGIDIVPEAVRQARRRGASALRRDVFDRLPGEGRWDTALLADGNVGIGGDPVALLRRAAELVRPGGRIVVEVAPPGVPDRRVWATLECDATVSRPFRWAVVGVDGVAALAARAGLVLAGTHPVQGRWFVVLRGIG